MTANRPKMPRPDPLSATTTAAAWLAWTGVAIGLVQLDSAAGVEDDGPGVEETEVAGTTAAGAAGTAGGAIPPFAGGAKGVRVGAGAGRAGAGATRGAAGAAGCTGVGAGAGAFRAGGAGAGVGTGAAVLVGAGEPDDGGAMGAGDSEHCCSGRQAAWAAPAAPATTVNASMAAVIPGSSAPRRRVIRIMEVPLQPRRTPRAEFCPGYLPTVRRGAPNRLLPVFRRQRDLELAHLAPANDVAASRNEVGADPSE
ncbi:hypothetical protein QFZ23_001554 [Arthrobacter globiformis]|nr:hypothetical protein [Arthrobacter globiformis]